MIDPVPTVTLLLPVVIVVHVRAPNVLAPAPSVPDVEMLVDPKAPTENVPDVICEAGRLPTVAADMAPLGKETVSPETVNPFDAVREPAVTMLPVAETLLLKVAAAPDTVSPLDAVRDPAVVTFPMALILLANDAVPPDTVSPFEENNPLAAEREPAKYAFRHVVTEDPRSYVLLLFGVTEVPKFPKENILCS